MKIDNLSSHTFFPFTCHLALVSKGEEEVCSVEDICQAAGKNYDRVPPFF